MHILMYAEHGYSRMIIMHSLKNGSVPKFNCICSKWLFQKRGLCL